VGHEIDPDCNEGEDAHVWLVYDKAWAVGPINWTTLAFWIPMKPPNGRCKHCSNGNKCAAKN
jgi:hypothetical protein